MNVKPLLKHFPELNHLPLEQQLSVLQTAHQKAYGPEQKMRVWRRNLAAGTITTAICYFWVTKFGPLLNLSPTLTAFILIIVVLPLFLVWQQKQLIRNIRLQLPSPLPPHG